MTLGDTGLTLVLPPGWARTEKKEFAETFGAFASNDSRASIFFSPAKTNNPQADMHDIMRALIEQYEEAFLMRRIGEIKTGRLAGAISAFAIFDADLRAKQGPDTVRFRFYLTVIDVGSTLYVAQGSVQQPVDARREAELMQILRSLAIKVPN